MYDALCIWHKSEPVFLHVKEIPINVEIRFLSIEVYIQMGDFPTLNLDLHKEQEAMRYDITGQKIQVTCTYMNVQYTYAQVLKVWMWLCNSTIVIRDNLQYFSHGELLPGRQDPLAALVQVHIFHQVLLDMIINVTMVDHYSTFWNLSTMCPFSGSFGKYNMAWRENSG